jgi:hypothetical protein
MPVVNIVDHRTNKYNVEVDAVFEPAWHDNSIKGSTKFNKTKDKDFFIEGTNKTTVEDAIDYINQRFKKIPVTMYLYDSGSGPIDTDNATEWVNF